MLVAQHLDVAYGERHVIRKVSCAMAPGETLVGLPGGQEIGRTRARLKVERGLAMVVAEQAPI